MTAISADGTAIAFERRGAGPPLVIVGGEAAIAGALEDRFTVFSYDRRDASPSVEREIEDLDAIIDEAGGSAAVLARGSGAVVALEAAADGSEITRLVLHEPAPLAIERFRSVTVPTLVIGGEAAVADALLNAQTATDRDIAREVQRFLL